MPRLNTNAILKPRVALTRETSKNNVIKKMLTDVDCVDIPCISFERGRDEISMTLLHDNDVVVLSSPQVKICLAFKKNVFKTLRERIYLVLRG